jgi:hypothetical protein
MLSAVTRVNRHAAMAGINDAINSLGWIEQHVLFSNIQVNFRFNMAAAKLPALAERLDALGVHLDAAASQEIAELVRKAEGNGGGKADAAELPASLAVTFLHNEPDMKREVPAVPG